MLPAVEDMAIEDQFYHDNRSGLVLPSGKLPSPASVSTASQRLSSAECERDYVSVASRQKRQ